MSAMTEQAPAVDRAPRRAAAAAYVALGLIVLAGLAVRLWLFSGTIGNDDLRHAYAAHFLNAPDAQKLAQVTWPDDVPHRRMGVNIPLFTSMRVFGVHDWSLALVPLTFSLMGIVWMFRLLRQLAGPWAGLAGAAMVALLPEDVYLATVWMQDSVFASVLTLWQNRYVLQLSVPFIIIMVLGARSAALAAAAALARLRIRPAGETETATGRTVMRACWRLRACAWRQRRSKTPQRERPKTRTSQWFTVDDRPNTASPDRRDSKLPCEL
jgi:hypothetical protein